MRSMKYREDVAAVQHHEALQTLDPRDRHLADNVVHLVLLHAFGLGVEVERHTVALARYINI
jgi:hypothetical protein